MKITDILNTESDLFAIVFIISGIILFLGLTILEEYLKDKK